IYAVGKPQLFDELRTGTDQLLEIGDAPRRQSAREVALDDLILDDEFTIHRRRGRAGHRSRGSRSLVHTRGIDTTRSFHLASKFRTFRFRRRSPPSLPGR